ncbi:hypothetical protein BH10PSE12_BH10PSE12_06300 [soil metagenome]
MNVVSSMNRPVLLAIAATLMASAPLGAQESAQQQSVQQPSVQGTAPQGQGFSQLDIRRPDAVNNLNGHLARLAENPRDVAALIGAGEAALALNDARAATGFFARADEIESGNGRIKAGLGRAMLEMQNPGEALRMFDQSTRMGYPATSFLSDRGLARDLTGDQAGAQRDYQTVLQGSPNDTETILRYAVSLGISGQVDPAEKLLQPLLYKGDRAAWRDRAFILAMNGRKEQARDITTKTMPRQLAEAIQPYMERMQGLTPVQRAAAVHFGHFPSDVGVRLASASPQPAVPVPAAAAKVAPAPAVSKAEQRRLAKAEQRRLRDEARQKTRMADNAARESYTASRTAGGTKLPTSPSVAQPAVQMAAAPPPPPEIIYDTSGDSPPATSPVQQAQPTVRQSAPVPVVPHPTPSPTPIPAPIRSPVQAPVPGPVQQSSPASNQMAHQSAIQAQVQGPPAPERPVPAPAAQTVPASSAPSVAVAKPEAPAQAPTPAPTSRPAPDPEATRTLADIMRELKVPEEEKQANSTAITLTDLEIIQQQKRTAKAVAAEKAKKDVAAKAKAAADVKAKAEATEKARLAKLPSRAWVQVGTGRDIAALGFTMKGLRKKYESLATRDAYTASWGRTNRLVVGPFASFTKAKEYEERLKKGGADAFAWQSDAGEEVEALSAK